MDPVSPSTQDGDQVAQLLLAHVPKGQRNEMLRGLIHSVQLDDQSSVDFAASLVLYHQDDEIKNQFLSLLLEAILSGEVDCAVSISKRSPELGCELLARAAAALQTAKFNGAELLNEDSIEPFLGFAQHTLSHLPYGTAHLPILHACLNLLPTGSPQMATDARDVVFTLLSTSDENIKSNVVLPSIEPIWTSLSHLISSGKKEHHPLLGYSLWLRLLLSIQPKQYQILIREEYWQLILSGLRHGDTETRKICLSILRTTTAADSPVVSQDMAEQYARYCTVFETIVLGRYINQIHECESDLDVLAASSALERRWLFTLLASSLGVQMQESSRKFIGSWVMRASWEPTQEFLDFFRDVFLPWAILGSLFVPSLRRVDGRMRCFHGERLFKFLQTLLADGHASTSVIEIVVDTIAQKRSSMFVYAIIFLVEGLGTTLSDGQKEKLSVFVGLPEVARDYLVSRTQTSNDAAPRPKHPSKREIREQKCLNRCRSFDADTDDMEELWNELDYLEYPKNLVMAIPRIVFHPVVIRRAWGDETKESSIKDKLQALTTMTQTKNYLFSPLVLAIRRAIFAVPNDSEFRRRASMTMNLERFVLDIILHPPAATLDLMLEEVTTSLTAFGYEHYFGPRLEYGMAVFIDLVSRIGGIPDANQVISNGIMERWKRQNIPPPTVSPWKNKLQLQILLLIHEQWNPDSPAAIHTLLDDLFHVLAIEALPHYRYLLEWIIIRLITRFQLQQTLLDRLGTKDHHSNPKHLASLMKIAVILACDPDAAQDFTLQLATSFVPLAASSKIVIRHEAQWQVPLLMDHARSKGWSRVTEDSAFVALDAYIRSLDRFHDPPAERQNGRFDSAKDHTLTNLVEGKWLLLDAGEKPLTIRDEFIKLHDSDIELDLHASCMPLGPKSERPPAPPTEDLPIIPAKNVVIPRTADDVSLALQTKGAAYLARTLSDHSVLKARPDQLIVIGSLVDNPYNLGGLSRVSEIFGASALCLQNQNVVSSKDFLSVAVSSHLHFPIVQLSASGVPEFLAERKKEGFVVVGIEQTDRSMVLGSESAVLPEKVVLVVGSEREGIPAVVLTECDVLVEIPQMGITRSLNVQTAVAIVLFEYARQHRVT